MLISPSSQQALRALIHLARSSGQEPVLARNIAEAEGIPRPFLSKLLHTLKNQGIVRSVRGPGGGYILARPAGRIRISEVVESFEGAPGHRSQCILGLDECSDATGCALHKKWKRLREQYARSISDMTLSEVASLPAGRKRAASGPAKEPPGAGKRSRTTRRRRT